VLTVGEFLFKLLVITSLYSVSEKSTFYTSILPILYQGRDLYWDTEGFLASKVPYL